MRGRQLCRASGSVWLKITADTTVFTPRRRSKVIIRGGLQAWNKCPCVIDYTLQANEINTAWIDWVEITPGGGANVAVWSGAVDALMFRVVVEEKHAAVFGFLAPVFSSPTIWFGHRWHWLQWQAAASRIWQALYLTISGIREKNLSHSSKGKRHQCCEGTCR